MAQDSSKLDLLLKMVEENEKKRVVADERTRAEYLELKKMVESRIPAVERKVEDIGEAFQAMNTKVDLIESTLQRQIKTEKTSGGNGKIGTASGPSSPKFSGTASEQATWEDLEELKARFPKAMAWGQAISQGEGIVRCPPVPPDDDVAEEEEEKLAEEE
ncbi:uncharacterized protein [Oryza sativa Japonica Group]|uniref:uncharacterized protein n=1 Tax=Oryza sativa subsp. japonica TaxID=39947 RepID=UPI000E1BF153|nr:uncharacterized protein LOC112937431 [Oryza sativa Japonica Group]